MKLWLLMSSRKRWRNSIKGYLPFRTNPDQISMTQDGDPRDNAIAERVNEILKTEWLYDDHFVGFENAYRRVAEVINLYNNKWPHLSLKYKTPAEVFLEQGE